LDLAIVGFAALFLVVGRTAITVVLRQSAEAVP
jgi:hypothetical protein